MEKEQNFCPKENCPGEPDLFFCRAFPASHKEEECSQMYSQDCYVCSKNTDCPFFK